MKVRNTCLFILTALLLAGCAGGPGTGPGQLATRAIETRIINAPYDIAYSAATHSLFALGFTISHSDKNSGLLVGRYVDPHRGKKIASIVLFGVLGALVDSKETFDVTLFLIKRAENDKTTIRIQMSVNGQPKLDKLVVSRIWVVAQREAMLETGATIPKELEAKFKELEKTGGKARSEALEKAREKEQKERRQMGMTE